MVAPLRPIFEGTLDRFRRLKICAAHGGGFLPSYTDFPTEWNSKGVDHVLGTSTLSDGDKKAILGGNAPKLLQIDPQPGSRSIHAAKHDMDAEK